MMFVVPARLVGPLVPGATQNANGLTFELVRYTIFVCGYVEFVIQCNTAPAASYFQISVLFALSLPKTYVTPRLSTAVSTTSIPLKPSTNEFAAKDEIPKPKIQTPNKHQTPNLNPIRICRLGAWDWGPALRDGGLGFGIWSFPERWRLF